MKDSFKAILNCSGCTLNNKNSLYMGMMGKYPAISPKLFSRWQDSTYIYIYIIIIYIIYIFINISLFLSRPIHFLLEFWQILPKNMFIEKRGWCVLPSYIPLFFLGTTPFLPVCNAMAFCFWGLPCPRVASAVQRQRPGRRLYTVFWIQRRFEHWWYCWWKKSCTTWDV